MQLEDQQKTDPLEILKLSELEKNLVSLIYTNTY